MRRTAVRSWWIACAAMLLAAAAPAIADQPRESRDTQPGITWEQLSPDQQKVLGKFRGRWDDLPPGQQQSLMRGAERWESMTPEQRERVKQRTERWRNMTPDERQRAREQARKQRQKAVEGEGEEGAVRSDDERARDRERREGRDR